MRKENGMENPSGIKRQSREFYSVISVPSFHYRLLWSFLLSRCRGEEKEKIWQQVENSLYLDTQPFFFPLAPPKNGLDYIFHSLQFWHNFCRMRNVARIAIPSIAKMQAERAEINILNPLCLRRRHHLRGRWVPFPQVVGVYYFLFCLGIYATRLGLEIQTVRNPIFPALT